MHYFQKILIIILSALMSSALVKAGPLAASKVNPRYFTDGTGKVVFLAGIHTWRNFQTFGSSNPPNDNFNFAEYLSYLVSNNLNYTRLWSWENSKDPSGLPGHFVSPMPFERSGPGNAQDGLPKFDLSTLNQDYFDRLRQRVVAAGNQGIYVGIQLFNGWSVGVKNKDNPWRYHPFYCPSAPQTTNCNNAQGINGDANADGNGYEVHTLANSTITAIQKTYVKKVIDTVNDLDNVLYEIANETEGGSSYVAWQNHLIDYIHKYQSTLPKQHPVGFSVPYPNGNNTDLFASSADWISPNDGDGYKSNPPASDGSKVIISDTDHLWGLGGDRYWAWKSFTRGLHVSYMDCYHEETLGCPISFSDPTRVSLISNLGYIRRYAEKINLISMIPSGSLTSTGYALVSQSEYLVYAPSGGVISVNLGNTLGSIAVEWFNPSNGAVINGGIISGGNNRSFNPPFSGDAVLFLRNLTATLSAPINLMIVNSP